MLSAATWMDLEVKSVRLKEANASFKNVQDTHDSLPCLGDVELRASFLKTW